MNSLILIQTRRAHARRRRMVHVVNKMKMIQTGIPPILQS